MASTTIPLRLQIKTAAEGPFTGRYLPFGNQQRTPANRLAPPHRLVTGMVVY